MDAHTENALLRHPVLPPTTVNVLLTRVTLLQRTTTATARVRRDQGRGCAPASRGLRCEVVMVSGGHHVGRASLGGQGHLCVGY